MKKSEHLFVGLMVVLLAGCGDSGTPKPSKHITLDNFTAGAWPFTFWGGNIQCQDREGVAIKSETGQVYKLNGTAQGQDLMGSGVWKDNPDIPGAKISVSPVIDHARKACGYR